MAMSDSAYEKVVKELKGTGAHRDNTGLEKVVTLSHLLSINMAVYRDAYALLGDRANGLFKRAQAMELGQFSRNVVEQARRLADRAQRARTPEALGAVLDGVEAAIVEAEHAE